MRFKLGKNRQSFSKTALDKQKINRARVPTGCNEFVFGKKNEYN